MVANSTNYQIKCSELSFLATEVDGKIAQDLSSILRYDIFKIIVISEWYRGLWRIKKLGFKSIML